MVFTTWLSASELIATIEPPMRSQTSCSTAHIPSSVES
jgi:hypothetical protein